MASTSPCPSAVRPVPESTVVEFAAKHCAAHGDVSAKAINVHVNAIILAALTQNRALWSVGLDSDGRASLIWISLPEMVWEHLLSEGVQLVTLMAWFGYQR